MQIWLLLVMEYCIVVLLWRVWNRAGWQRKLSQFMDTWQACQERREAPNLISTIPCVTTDWIRSRLLCLASAKWMRSWLKSFKASLILPKTFWKTGGNRWLINKAGTIAGIYGELWRQFSVKSISAFAYGGVSDSYPGHVFLSNSANFSSQSASATQSSRSSHDLCQ